MIDLLIAAEKKGSGHETMAVDIITIACFKILSPESIQSAPGPIGCSHQQNFYFIGQPEN
ncbi:MAG: hypothetical protein IPO37_01140 [Saprospiraceae bacterium]|nr:hypothetical protein [Saprospiraceae bacterium]